MRDFGGKIAAITGSGGGMGLSLAIAMLEAGASVLALDVKSKPQELDIYGERVLYKQIDLTDFSAVETAFAEAGAKFERLDYLANVAGVLWFGRDCGATEIDLDIWDQVMNINLKAMVHTVKCAVPMMVAAGGGAMVHVSTVQFLRGDTHPQDAYQASKAGVCALSRSLAIQHAYQGVRSNTVLPGVTWTPLQSRWEGDETTQDLVAKAVPLQRMGKAQDMANACMFLLSDDASYITGVDLPVDGGLLVKPVA